MTEAASASNVGPSSQPPLFRRKGEGGGCAEEEPLETDRHGPFGVRPGRDCLLGHRSKDIIKPDGWVTTSFRRCRLYGADDPHDRYRREVEKGRIAIP